MQYTSILYVVKILNKVLNTIEKNKKIQPCNYRVECNATNNMKVYYKTITSDLLL